MPNTFRSRMKGIEDGRPGSEFRKAIIRKYLIEGQKVKLICNTCNRNNKCSVGVHATTDEGEQCIGFLNDGLTDHLYSMIKNGIRIDCTAEEIAGREEGQSLAVYLELSVYSAAEMVFNEVAERGIW